MADPTQPDPLAPEAEAYAEATGIDPETALVMEQEAPKPPVKPTVEGIVREGRGIGKKLRGSVRSLASKFTDATTQYLKEHAQPYDPTKAAVSLYSLHRDRMKAKFKSGRVEVPNPEFQSGMAVGPLEKSPQRFITKSLGAEYLRGELTALKKKHRLKFINSHKKRTGKAPTKSEIPAELSPEFWEHEYEWTQKVKDKATGGMVERPVVGDKRQYLKHFYPSFFLEEQWTDSITAIEADTYSQFFSRGHGSFPSHAVVQDWIEKVKRVRGRTPSKADVAKFKSEYKDGHRAGGHGKPPGDEVVRDWVAGKAAGRGEGYAVGQREIDEFKKEYELGRPMMPTQKDMVKWRTLNSPEGNVIAQLAKNFTNDTRSFKGSEGWGQVAAPMFGMSDAPEEFRRESSLEIFEGERTPWSEPERAGEIAFAATRPEFGSRQGKNRLLSDASLAERVTLDWNIPGQLALGFGLRAYEAVTGDDEYARIGGELNITNVGRSVAELGPAVLDYRNWAALAEGTFAPIAEAYDSAGSVWAGNSKAGEGWFVTGYKRIPAELMGLVAFPFIAAKGIAEHLTSVEEYERKWPGGFHHAGSAIPGGIGAVVTTGLIDFPKAWEENPVMLALIMNFGAKKIAQGRVAEGSWVKAAQDAMTGEFKFRQAMREYMEHVDKAKFRSGAPDPLDRLAATVEKSAREGVREPVVEGETAKPLSPAARRRSIELQQEIRTRPTPREAPQERTFPEPPGGVQRRLVTEAKANIERLRGRLKTSRRRAKHGLKRELGRWRRKLRVAERELARVEAKPKTQVVDPRTLRETAEPTRIPRPPEDALPTHVSNVYDSVPSDIPQRTYKTLPVQREFRTYRDDFGREWVLNDIPSKILERFDRPKLEFDVGSYRSPQLGPGTHPSFKGYRELIVNVNRLIDQTILRVEGPGRLSLSIDNHIVFDRSTGRIVDMPMFKWTAQQMLSNTPGKYGIITLKWPQATFEFAANATSPAAGFFGQQGRGLRPWVSEWGIQGKAHGYGMLEAVEGVGAKQRAMTTGGMARLSMAERAIKEAPFTPKPLERVPPFEVKPLPFRRVPQRLVTESALERHFPERGLGPLKKVVAEQTPPIETLLKEINKLPGHMSQLAPSLGQSLVQWPKSVFGMPLSKPVNLPMRMGTYLYALAGHMPMLAEKSFRLVNPLFPWEISKIMYNRFLKDSKGFVKLKHVLRSPSVLLAKYQAIIDEFGRANSRDEMAMRDALHAIPPKHLPVSRRTLDMDNSLQLFTPETLKEIAPVDPVTGVRSWGNLDAMLKRGSEGRAIETGPATRSRVTKTYKPGGKWSMRVEPVEATGARAGRPLTLKQQKAKAQREGRNRKIEAARAYKAVMEEIKKSGGGRGYPGIQWNPKGKVITPETAYEYVNWITGERATWKTKEVIDATGAFQIDPNIATLFRYGRKTRGTEMPGAANVASLPGKLELLVDFHNQHHRAIGKYYHNRVRKVLTEEGIFGAPEQALSFWTPNLFPKSWSLVDWLKEKFGHPRLPRNVDELNAMKKQFENDSIDLLRGPSAQRLWENTLRKRGVTPEKRIEMYGMMPDPTMRIRLGYQQALHLGRRAQMFRSIGENVEGSVLGPGVVPRGAEVVRNLKGKTSNDVVAYTVDGRPLYYFGEEALYTWFDRSSGKINPKTGKPGGKQMPSEAKKWASFSGKFVDAQLARHIIVAEQMANAAGGFYAGLIRFLKGSKTFLHPGTTLRNLYTNVFLFAPLAGIHWLNPLNAPLYAKALKDFMLKEKSLDFREAIEHKVFGKNWTSQEAIYKAQVDSLRGIFEPAGDITARLLDLPAAMISGDVAGFKGSMRAVLWEYPGMLYGALDNFFRYVAYLKYKKSGPPKWVGDRDWDIYKRKDPARGEIQLAQDRGLRPEQAAELANKAFMDYSDVPGFVQYLRAPSKLKGGTALFSLVGRPFISFTAKAVPQVMKALTENPVMAAIWQPVWDYYNAIASEEAGVSQDQLEAMGRAKRPWEAMITSMPVGVRPLEDEKEIERLIAEGVIDSEHYARHKGTMPWVVFEAPESEREIRLGDFPPELEKAKMRKYALSWEAYYMNFGPYLVGGEFFPKPPPIGEYDLMQYVTETLLPPQVPPFSWIYTLLTGKKPVTGQRVMPESLTREDREVHFKKQDSVLRVNVTEKIDSVTGKSRKEYKLKKESEMDNTVDEGWEIWNGMHMEDRVKYYPALTSDDREEQHIPMLDLKGQPENSSWRKFAAFAGYVAEDIVPTWTPFFGYSWKKYIAAKNMKPDARGRMRTPAEVELSDLWGIRIEKHNTTEQQNIMALHAQTAWRKIKGELTRRYSAHTGFTQFNLNKYAKVLSDKPPRSVAARKRVHRKLEKWKQRYMMNYVANAHDILEEYWDIIKFLPQPPLGTSKHSDARETHRSDVYDFLDKWRTWSVHSAEIGPDWMAEYVLQVNRVFTQMAGLVGDHKLEDYRERIEVLEEQVEEGRTDNEARGTEEPQEEEQWD